MSHSTVPTDRRHSLYRIAWLLILLLSGAATPWTSPTDPTARGGLPGAPGRHIAPYEWRFDTAPAFSSQRKLVATYYFFWYDVRTGAHVIDPDGSDALQDHPATWPALRRPDFSYEDVEWHKGELRDMIAAGIDVMLPVFWGTPGAYHDWNFRGLAALVRAQRELRDAGERPPQIGMFYDTSTLELAPGNVLGAPMPLDLTTTAGRWVFYGTVRDFYSMIPPDLWARVDGGAVVWLYSAAFARAYDQGSFDFLRREFSTDFGGAGLYVVREVSWQGVTTDSAYAWGAALNGYSNHGVAAVGPGYDDRAVPGRTTPQRDRANGAFYEQGFAIAQAAKVLVIETWNEFHEGTDICASYEYGRDYIDRTARLVRAFKGNEHVVAALYLDLLGRAAETGGLASWTTELDRGAVGREEAARRMLRSEEFLRRNVRVFYRWLLRREPDPVGMANFVAAQQGAMRTRDLVVALCASDEYRQRAGATAEAFVRRLYEDLLGRSPDAAGLALHAGRLAAGQATPADTVRGLLDSPEYHGRFIDMAYWWLLGRPVDPSGRQTFGRILASGAPWESLVAALAGSAEYFDRAQSR